ncbi:endoglucanase 1-like [Saccoglossus kowalevskii]|uniref:Endoglucanase n=1 Tax=Saccoglossus kowalevskii TaxID=10224 RepID=A0ABM0GJX0_SACKO|nr:PREDICTED: endoglucanase 11-like [Saccoglossus kowalevskii]
MSRLPLALSLVYFLAVYVRSEVYEQPPPNLPLDDPSPDVPDNDDVYEVDGGIDKRSTGYDYRDALIASVEFFEAQRSGPVPEDGRVQWRKPDIAQFDTGANGEDLSGGMYDAGDHIKFNLPMAWTTTMMAWSYIEFEDAYIDAGEDKSTRDLLKWNCDYFIKCHPSADVFYHQVGDPGVDHSQWNRPENISSTRPSYQIEDSGADVAGETAAALAGCAKVFEHFDTNYASECEDKAKSLFMFALNHPGLYPPTIYYKSNGAWDEVAWAAIWLYWLTGDEWYRQEAVNLYDSKNLNRKSYVYGWNDKREGLKLLMGYIHKDINKNLKKKYWRHFKSYMNGWLPGGTVTYTPKGLACRDAWGSLRWAGNSAALAVIASHYGIRAPAYRNFAKSQLDYILGSSGHSYVVGVGENPPTRPHHRGSSCPVITETCTNSNSFNYDGPNHHLLRGAMVGGPNCSDDWDDNRKDYVKNEVACDYNAGFQTLVAGVQSLILRGILV